MTRATRGAAEPRAAPPRRARVLRKVAWGFAWTLVFVLMLVLSASIHLDTPALRASVAAAINSSLAGAYRGRIELGEIESLGAFRASVRELRVLGEKGERVLDLSRVKLQYHPLELLRAALGEGAPLSVDHVRIDQSRVVLALDPESGEWSLVRALSKRPRARPPRPSRTPTVYSFAAIEIGKLELVVDHPSFGQLEARIDRLQGGATVGGNDNSVTVERFGVRLTAPDGSNLDGTGSFRLLPRGFVAGTFHGFLDGTELDAAGSWDEGILTLRLGVPLALPEQVRRRLPAWPLQAPLVAEAEARGPPEALRLQAKLRAQGSQLQIEGTARLTAPASARLALHAESVDARLFAPAAPDLRVTARAEAEAQFQSTGPSVAIRGETEPATLGGVALPATTFTLQVEPEVLRARLRGADARGEIEAELERSGPERTALSLAARELTLQAFPLRGVRGKLDASVQAGLAGARLSGTFDARIRALRAGMLGATRARASGSFTGQTDALRELQLDAKLALAGVEVGATSFDAVNLTTRGTLWRSSLAADLTRRDGRGRVSGIFHHDEAVWFEKVEVAWTAAALALLARAERVAPERAQLRGGVFELSGSSGRLSGSLDIAAGGMQLTADADAFDLGALTRVMGWGAERVAGRVSGRVELAQGRAGGGAGKLDLEIEDLAARDVAIGSVELDARLEDNQLDAALATKSSPLGSLSANGHLQLGGQVLAAQSWQRATGQVSAKLAQLPLWPLGLVVAKHSRVKSLDGRLEAALELERSAPDALPNVFIQAGTSELAFDLAGDPAEAKASSRHFDRFALHGSASIDGASGHGVATLAVTDEHGALVTTSGSLELDLPDLLENPRDIIQELVQTPLDALIRLHPRPLSLLPPPLSIGDLTGSVDATLQLRGSLADPTLSLSARGQQLLGSFADPVSAVDVSAGLDYAPNTGKLVARADVVQAGQRLVAARLEGRVPNPLSHEHALEQAELRAAAMLNGVPLELWPFAAKHELLARVYGSVDIDRSAERFEQRAQLEIGGLTVAGRAMGNGRLTLQNRGNGVHAELRMGSARRELRATLSGLPPSEGEPLAFRGSVSTRGFDAASLSPLVSDVLSDVSGDMDADLEFSLRPNPPDGWYLGIDGEAALSRASARLDLFGLDLRELAARVQARSTPEYTVIQVQELSAHARSREPNLSGDAELWLRGLRLVSGEANLSLAEVPLSLKGATRGTARGALRARLEREPDHMALEVKIPDLRLTLPASSTRSLISLDDNPEFDILQARTEREPRSRDALLWKMKFSLGDGVRIRRADLDIPLAGEPRLEYQHELRPSGTIEAAPGGRISLFDQTFTIDRGVVQLVPDQPDNPRIDLTASWRAPDGTTVYVDVTGSAKQATVLTRDDRGLEDVERFYLLTGNMARADGAGPGLAEGAGEDAALGQTFALGVNELLRESVGNVRVSVGTTADDRASYGASVRLSDKLTFQGHFRPASESGLEQSTNDLTGTLDYRFSRRWSLRTELGTSGGAFDLLWSHRY